MEYSPKLFFPNFKFSWEICKENIHQNSEIFFSQIDAQFENPKQHKFSEKSLTKYYILRIIVATRLQTSGSFQVYICLSENWDHNNNFINPFDLRLHSQFFQRDSWSFKKNSFDSEHFLKRKTVHEDYLHEKGWLPILSKIFFRYWTILLEWN